MDYTVAEKTIILGMKEMVEIDGKTPHEVIKRLNEIENEIFFALFDLKKGSK